MGVNKGFAMEHLGFTRIHRGPLGSIRVHEGIIVDRLALVERTEHPIVSDRPLCPAGIEALVIGPCVLQASKP